MSALTRAEKLAAYTDLVAGFDDLAIKGKATSYTSMNGNMFSFLAPDGTLAFRLSKDDYAEFEGRYGNAEVRQYGSVMRGYVGVPDEVIRDADALSKLFAACVAHAKTLKPKPTKKT